MGDVTARRSKNDGELISLKPRPVTSRAVFYRIKLAVTKSFRLQSARSEYQLGIKIFFSKIFPVNTLQFTEEYIAILYIVGFMVADLSKMAAIRLGLEIMPNRTGKEVNISA